MIVSQSLSFLFLWVIFMFTAQDIVLKCSLGNEVYFTYLLVSFSLVSLQNYSIKILHLPATKVFFKY